MALLRMLVVTERIYFHQFGNIKWLDDFDTEADHKFRHIAYLFDGVQSIYHLNLTLAENTPITLSKSPDGIGAVHLQSALNATSNVSPEILYPTDYSMLNE